MTKIVIGAGGGKGGGGGGGHVPVESPDSLRSRQYARIIDMVSEGEIVGLVDGLKSVYLDDTPIQNADGSMNFSGVTLDSRTGTQHQGYIAGFPAVENEVAVSAEVTRASSVTRTVSNSNIDAVRVTIAIPALSYQNPSNGDLGGTSVTIAIDRQSNGGGFVEVVNDTISGKTISKYQRAYRIDLVGTGPWDIRVRRITPDSAQANLANKTWWDSYTEIVDSKLRYPNSALMALQIDSGQFRTIPRRGYDIKGILVRVPNATHYNPTTRTYTGVWDGTFTYAWTDNPAWVFYDLLLSNRYGLGEYIDATQVDKWALHSIAKYCDQPVPNGFGGTEPRFTCNTFIQTREDAYKLLLSLASVFRGIVWWQSNSVIASADMPTDPSMLFAPSNVVDGRFNYSGSSARTRHTVALVAWNDPADHYKQKIEYVEDLDGIATYGVNETEVVAMGCTSRGQAHRFGKWLLWSEVNETETVTFRCGFDGTYITPNSVFQTQDPTRAGKRFGGRIISATTTSVTLDSPVTLESGKTYTLSVVLTDGAVQSRSVTTGVGTTSDLTISPALTSSPQPMSMWVLAANDLVPETWRTVSVSEPEPGVLEITGLTYRADKYAAVEYDVVLQPTPTSSPVGVPLSPVGLVVTESLYQSGPDVRTQINVSWHYASDVSWVVRYKYTDGNWVVMPSVNVPSISLLDMLPGFITVSIVAVSKIGRASAASSVSVNVLGKTAPPQDVANFHVLKSAGIGHAEWELHPDLDVRVDGKIVIRHSPMTSGASWINGVIVGVFDGNSTTGNVPLMSGTYMAKAVDSSSNWSNTEASAPATAGMTVGYTTTANITQDPTFSGAKTNTVVIGNALTLASNQLTGTYDFSTHLDMTTVATRRFEADIVGLSAVVGDNIDARTDTIDSWPNIDGGTVNDCDATLYVSTTNGDPAGAPTWGPWVPFMVADFTCRAARFQVRLERGSMANNISISTLRVDVKVPV